MVLKKYLTMGEETDFIYNYPKLMINKVKYYFT